MGASATSRLSNKDYSIMVIYATENEKVLDLTTKNNVKCYTWSLLKRLSTATSQYTPTNKMVKFVKSKTDTFSNVKVVTLSNFYGTYAEAKAELESISNKTDIETIDDIDSGTNAEIKQIKSKLTEPKLT